MATTVLARYAYDNAGRLRSPWDPRLDYDGGKHVGEVYSYDADGVLSQLRPAGQEPWQRRGRRPYDLSAARTARWGQKEHPVGATAVFGADQVPGGNPALQGWPTGSRAQRPRPDSWKQDQPGLIWPSSTRSWITP